MKRIADLSVFVSVVKAGSLSEASNDLGLSVASISKYISRIEQELGVRVLVRNARGLRLTSEGQALYVRVDTLLSQLNKVLLPSLVAELIIVVGNPVQSPWSYFHIASI